MSIKSKRNFLTAMVVVGVSASAHAQLAGLLGGSRASTGGADIGPQIDRFNADSAVISKAMAYSLLQIKAALGTKEQVAQVVKQASELTKTTDAKEAGSLQGTIIKTEVAQVAEMLKHSSAKARIEKLSPEIQKKVAQSIFAVAVSSLKIPGLLDGGRKIVEGVGANPMMLSKIAEVKDGMSLLGDALPTLGPIVSTGMALMREVKVDPGNPTAAAELKPDTSVTVPDSFGDE